MHRLALKRTHNTICLLVLSSLVAAPRTLETRFMLRMRRLSYLVYQIHFHASSPLWPRSDVATPDARGKQIPENNGIKRYSLEL